MHNLEKIKNHKEALKISKEIISNERKSVLEVLIDKIEEIKDYKIKKRAYEKLCRLNTQFLTDVKKIVNNNKSDKALTIKILCLYRDKTLLTIDNNKYYNSIPSKTYLKNHIQTITKKELREIKNYGKRKK